jgi:hypothetical protein
VESASNEAFDGEVLGECLRFKLVRRTVESPDPKCFGASESDARCGKGILDAYAVSGAFHEDILYFSVCNCSLGGSLCFSVRQL